VVPSCRRAVYWCRAVVPSYTVVLSCHGGVVPSLMFRSVSLTELLMCMPVMSPDLPAPEADSSSVAFAYSVADGRQTKLRYDGSWRGERGDVVVCFGGREQ
jgi:hypothetical protein